MGNSSKSSGCQLSSGRNADAGNGILLYLGGDQVAAAKRQFPAPNIKDELCEAVLDVEGFGPVRFFARALRGSHRSSVLFWSIYRAERVETDELPV